MALIWIGTASSPSFDDVALGLHLPQPDLCADVSAASWGLCCGPPLASVDQAAYSVMHELQLCQRITSVAPWRSGSHPLSLSPSLPGDLWPSHQSPHAAWYIQVS